MSEKTQEWLSNRLGRHWPSIKKRTSNRLSERLHSLAQRLIAAKQQVFNSTHGPISYWETVKEPGQETIVFLHGFGDSKHSFYPSAIYLAKHYHIIVPDLPGFGDSFKALHLRYDNAAYSQWIQEWLDYVGVGKFHLVGNSLGGGLSLALSLDCPQRIKSLSVIDPGGIPLEGPPSLYQEIFAGRNIFSISSREEFEYFLSRVFHRRYYIPWPIKENLYRVFLDHSDWYQMLLDHLLEGITGFDDPEISSKAFNGRLGEIDIPTLVLWGEHDSFFPVETAEYMGKQIKNSQVHIFKDVGHSPQIEVPRSFSAVYRRFLMGLS